MLPLILLFVVLSTAPRVFTSELWGDEFRTWRDGIEKPLSAVLTWHHNPDHAPLGHLLARTGAAIFGVEHPWALRLGNYLCGLLCVPALWWMGRTLSGNAVGLLAAGMFAVDPNCLFQITQARMYGALLLAGICAFTLAGSILNDPRKPWRRAVFLGVALAAGIWAHSTIYALIFAVLLVASGSLFVRRRTGVALLVAVLIGGAVGAQGVAKIVSRHDAEKIETPNSSAAGDQLSEAIESLGGSDGITVILAASTLGGAAVLFTRGNRALANFVVLVVALAVMNLVIASRYRPIANVRYLTILQPPMWLAMAVFVVAICRSRFVSTLGIASALLLVGLSIYEYGRAREVLAPHPLAAPFADAARAIRARISPGERFIVVPRSPYGMYTRYYGLTLDEPIDDLLAERTSTRRMRQATRDANLEQGRIWMLGVIQPSFTPPSGNDNPIDFANRVAAARETPVRLPAVDWVHESKRVVVVDIDDSKMTLDR